MTNLPPNPQNLTNQPTDEATELIRKLRQKEGNWVEWGQACAYLQKAGFNPQDIFEATGFEPIQQNQVIVGSQVYASMEKWGYRKLRDRTTPKGEVMYYMNCVYLPTKKELQQPI
ncbi:expressed protein [Richelia intracellularis]|nr:expressed protein [Richelia intracellularis]